MENMDAMGSASIKPRFVFVYQIEIGNESQEIMQLISREWYITDGLGHTYKVEGEGVVGRQPVMAPGDTYRYTSGTHFCTPIGKMEGLYHMRRFSDNSLRSVVIPEFIMVTPPLLN
jgi:ApaG protein